MLLAHYKIEPEQLGKLPQSIYDSLLAQVPAIVSYTQTGKIIDPEGERKMHEDNIKWMREKGFLKPKTKE